MDQRISLITLGVADVGASLRFYEQLGWQGQEVDETVFFQAGGLAVVLWGREKLAEDAGISDDGNATFGGIALAHVARLLRDGRPPAGPLGRYQQTQAAWTLESRLMRKPFGDVPAARALAWTPWLKWIGTGLLVLGTTLTAAPLVAIDGLGVRSLQPPRRQRRLRRDQ